MAVNHRRSANVIMQVLIPDDQTHAFTIYGRVYTHHGNRSLYAPPIHSLLLPSFHLDVQQIRQRDPRRTSLLQLPHSHHLMAGPAQPLSGIPVQLHIGSRRVAWFREALQHPVQPLEHFPELCLALRLTLATRSRPGVKYAYRSGDRGSHE